MITIEKPDWFFYPIWIILTTVCIPVAFIINLIILRVITAYVGDFINVDGVRRITEDYLGMYTFVPIVGLLTGLLQYGLLRRYLPHMGWWVLATAGGWTLGAVLILVSSRLNIWTYESFDIDWAFIVMGLSIGVGQWILLRRCLPMAGSWVGVSVLGWGMLGMITGDSLGQFGLIAMGFFPACATAVMLAMIMNWAFPNEARAA